MRLKENEGRGGVNVTLDNPFHLVYGIKISDALSAEANFALACQSEVKLTKNPYRLI